MTDFNPSYCVINGTGYSAEFFNPSYYSEESFWTKVKRFARKARAKVIYLALLLYYTLVSPNTPRWAKVVIVSALAYFICPIDAVPDAIPLIGFTDDLEALMAAAAAVAVCITPEVESNAKSTLSDLLGDVDEAELA